MLVKYTLFVYIFQRVHCHCCQFVMNIFPNTHVVDYNLTMIYMYFVIIIIWHKRYIYLHKNVLRITDTRLTVTQIKQIPARRTCLFHRYKRTKVPKTATYDFIKKKKENSATVSRTKLQSISTFLLNTRQSRRQVSFKQSSILFKFIMTIDYKTAGAWMYRIYWKHNAYSSCVLRLKQSLDIWGFVWRLGSQKQACIRIKMIGRFFIVCFSKER